MALLITQPLSVVVVLFFFAEIGPVTITTDPKKFQFELRELYVQVGSEVTFVKPPIAAVAWMLQQEGHLALIKAADCAHTRRLGRNVC